METAFIRFFCGTFCRVSFTTNRSNCLLYIVSLGNATNLEAKYDRAAQQMLLPIDAQVVQTWLLLKLFFFLLCDYSDSTVTFYITVVENKIGPPVFTDEITIPEYRFLALLVSSQLSVYQLFRNSHCFSMCFCASQVFAMLGDWTAPKSTSQLHLPQDQQNASVTHWGFLICVHIRRATLAVHDAYLNVKSGCQQQLALSFLVLMSVTGYFVYLIYYYY